MLIYNAHIVSPQRHIPNGAVLIKDGRVVEVFEDEHDWPLVQEKIDAQGQLLVPGFIDIHTHGIGGYDVSDGTLEAITTISKLKMQEGTTTYCPTTLTLSKEKLQRSMAAVAAYKRKEAYAKVAGVHLEGPFVSREYIGAQNPDYARLPDFSEIQELNAITPVAIVTYAPELDGGMDFTSALSALGIIPSAGHSSATCSCIRQAEKVGLKHLTHFGNQMRPMHHREIGMVGAGLMDDALLIEIICDKIHLSEDMLQLVYRIKRRDQIAVVTDSLAATGLPDGDYDLGGMPIYVKNSEARLKHNKHLAGSTLRMNIALKNIAEVTGLPLEKLIQTTSYNQAKSLGIPDLGKIEANYVADLVLLKDDYSVSRVFVDGQEKYAN